MHTESLATFKYRAFISYSHVDEGWARWLHKSIENYRGGQRPGSAADLALQLLSDQACQESDP